MAERAAAPGADRGGEQEHHGAGDANGKVTPGGYAQLTMGAEPELLPCIYCGSLTLERHEGHGPTHGRCIPQHTVRTARATSWSAGARASRGPRSLLAQEVLRVLRTNGPKTDDELCEALPEAHAPSLSKRRRDLEVAGLVFDTGRTRKTRRGREAVIWAATR